MSKKILTRASMAGLPSVEQVRPARLHHRAEEDDPDQRDRDEHLPAEAHDLVVAVARERRADPQEDEQHARDIFDEQPEEAVAERMQRRAISSSLRIGNGDSQPPRNMIDASAEIRIMFMYSARKNTANVDARVLDVEAGDDLRLAFGHVERMRGWSRRRPR